MKQFATTLVFVLGSAMAHADSGRLSVPDNPKWKTECGSCHVAFPPQLLTRGDWKQMMDGLDRHFGANAELDARDNQEILAFLQRYAASGSKYSSPSLRISDTPWFNREHDEVPGRAWSDPAVKSRSNCTACHVNAERGDWSERGIRMPVGLRGERGERGRERDDD